jgi:hypothetical protein
VHLSRVALAALCCAGAAIAADEPKNWFGDPYSQLTHAIAACPEPRGPYITEAEALRESHHRAERGTRCHLEGRCRHPSSFDYDREIADHIRQAASEHRVALPRSTLWVLVQGRRVWIYGCVGASYRRGALEKWLRSIPDVEVATEEVRIGGGKVPYRTRLSSSAGTLS